MQYITFLQYQAVFDPGAQRPTRSERTMLPVSPIYWNSYFNAEVLSGLEARKAEALASGTPFKALSFRDRASINKFYDCTRK